MREILFRGKRTDNHQWVEGFYIEDDLDNPNPYIIDRWKHRVAHKTVGQYTGLTDKNGKKIFEGDILRIYYDKAPVIYSEENCVWYVRRSEGEEPPLNEYDKEYIKVIGNIHDNPELLEVL